MNARLFAVATLLAAAGAISPSASAVGLQINDGCGVTNVGNLTGSLGADSGGNLNIQGFTMNHWVAGQGWCETALPAGSPPRCTLLASHTNAEPNVGVTFHARCRTPAGQPITSYTWTGPVGGPAFPADAGGRNHLALAFAAKGTYSLTVQATNAFGMGPTSTPVTVLVGNPAVAADGPNCEVKFSPPSIVQNQSSQAIVSCQPAGTSVAWDAPEAGAPTATGALPVLTFPAPGLFTYKLRATNASGTYGPKAGATINVASDGSCSPGPYAAEYPVPANNGYSPDATAYPNQTVAFAFSVAPGGYATLGPAMHPAYTTYTFPNVGTISVSKCRGDFNVPPACQSPFYNYYFYMTLPTTPAAGYCAIEPNVTYYMNVKGTDCSNSPTGLCGFRIYRQH